MRHVTGLLAVAMAVVLFVAGSWGYLKLLASPARSGVLPAAGGSLMHDHAVVEGFAALLVVGLLAGILIAGPRISPLAAGLPGLALLAWTGLYLASARRAVCYIPLKSRVYGAGFEALLFDGVLALAGLVMIIPLFVPSRWMRRAVASAAPASYETPAPDYADQQATQTISGGLPPTGPRPGRSRSRKRDIRRRPGVPRSPAAKARTPRPTSAEPAR